MEAKDTLIKKEWMSREVQFDQERLMLEQAKISFQAGQDSIVDKENLNFKRGFQSALQMVQAKLKEWGLEEGK